MRFNHLLHLIATLALRLDRGIPWEGAWDPSGFWFRHSYQDAGFPCAFQVLRPISLHTYPCQGGREGLALSVREMERFLEQWQMDARDLRRGMILAPAPRERERWYARWLLTQGWAAQATAEALERAPPHRRSMGRRLRRGRAQSPDLRAFRGFPPALEEGQQAELKAAVQEPPTKWGIGLANWNWKAVWQFVQERFGISLSRSSCLNCLHRLGFAFKRPKKRLLQADAEKRDAVVAEYASLKSQAQEFGAKIFFADQAHFRADAELRCQWVLKGEPALVDSTSPRYGEKASCYAAVCLETGEVEWMELEGNRGTYNLSRPLMLEQRLVGLHT